ncbi:A disintegrin and metalloproteinase with thrombospondin motifs like isoform X1 [Centruroides vittatus]|uniref:A disintegrin and metalloproteinase with thrombospondin motifs like isoform X1 n=1 Tax=Centruroides vittatus TaxID=120091 RepID=UPI00350F0BC9
MSFAVIFFGLATLWICGESKFEKFHERLSQEELRKIFHVDLHDNVPEYDVVHVRSLSKRSILSDDTKRVHLSAFGQNFHLNLKRNHELEDRLKSMKLFAAETKGNELRYKEMEPQEHAISDMGVSYHDENQMAALLVNHAEDGSLQLEGTIGNHLVIKPIPKQLIVVEDNYVDDEMFLDEDGNTSTTPNMQRHLPTLSSANHVVYKRKQNVPLSHSDYMELEAGYANNSDWTIRSRRTKRKAPTTVWPEVLVVIDYNTFLLHGSDSRALKRYFVSFWNGVDLRYKVLANPKVKISLAGMVVAKDKDATPYLEKNRLRPPNYDAVDAAGALSDMGKYLYREDRLPTFDLAVVITKLDMCRRQFNGGRCSRGTAGFAYVGGACVVNKRLEKVNSVAIIEDSGGFSGIIVAAHEVGHLLGCVHDGSQPPSYLGGPGASNCPWEDGFIMSDLRHTDRGFQWSACSVQQFKHFLQGETAVCLYNYPHDNQILSRVLPGTTMSLDDQCRKDRGTTACFKDARVCAQLFCYDTSSGFCVSFRPAAEGSTCGHGQVCRDGRCVGETENIIPDYTHYTPTYAGRHPNFVYRRTDRRGTTPYISRTTREIITRTTPSQSPSSCEDNAQQLAGGLTCTEFLQRYGFRYCKHRYMKQKCCKSQLKLCSRS